MHNRKEEIYILRSLCSVTASVINITYPLFNPINIYIYIYIHVKSGRVEAKTDRFNEKSK